MMEWNATNRVKKSSGEYTITYEARDCPCRIEARRRMIPHANGSGGWLFTEYALIRPDGTERKYLRLKDAKETAEEEYE